MTFHYRKYTLGFLSYIKAVDILPFAQQSTINQMIGSERMIRDAGVRGSGRYTDVTALYPTG